MLLHGDRRGAFPSTYQPPDDSLAVFFQTGLQFIGDRLDSGSPGHCLRFNVQREIFLRTGFSSLRRFKVEQEGRQTTVTKVMGAGRYPAWGRGRNGERFAIANANNVVWPRANLAEIATSVQLP
ncbi:unnamed protein product [Caenorhabditis auriculariae]|uniref:Uncharacterized protein n=1 Tax=Caenorhabditis auriculariae TaxID=2777116 RepID=A0A8S1HD93_9PELO|nr:unnamed protein product [Caenorhabditis auriculariae]